MRRVLTVVAALAMLLSGEAVFAFEKAPAEVVRALGTVRGKPISTGFVFIDGKYLKPPYRVTRAGNQILLNERPVTGQLVSWEKLLETQPPSRINVTEVEVADEAPDEGKEPAAPERDGVDPAAPKDGGNAPPPPAPSADDDLFAQVRVRIVETRCAAQGDDLDDFKPGEAPEKMKLSDIPADTEADKARQKRAEEEAKEEESEESKEDGSGQEGASSGKDENGDELDPASPEGEAAAKAAAVRQPPPKPVAKKTRKVKSLAGKFELNFQAQKLLKPIDAYRMKLEATLRRGGYLFFGTGAKPYCKGRTSDAAAAKELLRKLPELMGKAEGSEAFCDAVRTAGLMSFINLQISQDLFRHKADAVFLKQRRRDLYQEEKLKQMMK